MVSTRRRFTAEALSSLATFALFELISARDAVADPLKPTLARWLADVNQLARDLKGQKLEQTAWQAKIEELFARVELADLLRFIDFDRLTAGVVPPDNGARSLRFQFPKVEGVSDAVVFGKQIFALKEGRSVVPHGHDNMATAFLILGGTLHGRHYERLEDQKDHIVIEPTIDRAFEAGGCSTISDKKDNVHWFKATSDRAYIFNLHVLDIDPDGAAASGRVYLDPMGEKLSGNRVRARRIGYAEAHKLYG